MSYKNEETAQEVTQTAVADNNAGLPELAPAAVIVAPSAHADNADPALLLVKGKNGENKQYIKSLAHAIVIVISKYGYASLKSVGASSVNNSVKAYTIAAGEAKTRGLDLVMSSGFQNAMFDDVEKTAIVFRVFNR